MTVACEPVGVGLDLSDAGRLATSLARRPGLAARLFTERERARLTEAARQGDPVPAAQYFALKEAVMKSLGVGVDSVAFTDIEVDPALGRVSLSGRAAQRATELGVRNWSCDVAVREGPHGPVATAEVLALR